MSRSAIALLLVVAMTAGVPAQRGGGGARGGAPRAAAPATRSAPGGFNFNRDVTTRPVAPPVQQRVPQPVQRPVQQPPNVRAPQPAQRAMPHAAYGPGNGPYAARFHGPVMRNPHADPHPWTWNHGVVWVAAPIYWGGGFWGPWAIATISTAILFGSIIDYNNQIIYPSYQVEPDSAGAQLLVDYGLQQTQCGPPDLVVIWGPNNSVICAFPNSLVAAGNYEVDPSTLTLVSATPP